MLIVMEAGMVAAMGSMFLLVPGFQHLGEAEAERNTALLIFPRDLRRKLDLSAEPSRVAIAEAEQE